MNRRTSFALLAALAAIGTLSMSAAHAQGEQPEACVGCSIEEARAIADRTLLDTLSVSIWTDKEEYDHNDMIVVKGMVADVSGIPVTITVVSPQNSIVTIDQIDLAPDGTFETTLNTAGSLWKYDGTYTIRANYGSGEKVYTAKVDLVGGVAFEPDYETRDDSKQCRPSELSVADQCMSYTITGGTVTGTAVDGTSKSIIISIDAQDDGTLTLNPERSVIDGIFMVLVDGQEWDDAEIVVNSVTVMFPAGTETVEVIGTFVIPEFGTIAAMILAVAIISIIAVSARSRLSIMPRY